MGKESGAVLKAFLERVPTSDKKRQEGGKGGRGPKNAQSDQVSGVVAQIKTFRDLISKPQKKKGGKEGPRVLKGTATVGKRL